MRKTQEVILRRLERKKQFSICLRIKGEVGRRFFKTKKSSGRARDILANTEKRKKLRGGRVGEMENGLLMRRSTAADDVEHGGLESDMVERKKGEEILAKRVANGKFSDKGGHNHVKTVVITSDGKFCKEGERVANAAGRSKIVTAEKRIVLHDCFKLKMKIGFNLVPGRV